MPFFALPLLLALVFLVSGWAKLRLPAQSIMESAASLGAPTVLRGALAARALPWAELLLALGFVVLEGTALRLWAGAAALVLAGFTVLIVRTLRRGGEAECACFGTTQPVTARAVIRNGLLLFAAVLVTVEGSPRAAGAALGEALLTHDGGALLPLLLAGGCFALGWAMTTARPAASERATGPGTPAEDAPPSMTGARVPRLEVTGDDGEVRLLLEELSRQGGGKAVLVAVLGEGCQACSALLPQLEQRQASLRDTVRIVVGSSAPRQSFRRTYPDCTLPVFYGTLSLRKSLGVQYVPTLFLVDREGRFATGLVDHPEDIQGFLAALGALDRPA